MATNNAINTEDPIQVARGGTGIATTTAYSVICAGTAATGAFQSLAALGDAGQVLTSNGAGALPSFQAGGGGGGSVTDTTNLYLSSDFLCETFEDSPFVTGGDWIAGTVNNGGALEGGADTSAVTGRTIYVGAGEVVIVGIAKMLYGNNSTSDMSIGLSDQEKIGNVNISTRAIYFAYDRSVWDVNIYAITRDASGTTATDTGIDTGNTWHKFTITVNSDASSVVFDIDGSTVATHTTNIPTTSDALYAGGFMDDGGGTTTGYIDFLSVKREYANSRY